MWLSNARLTRRRLTFEDQMRVGGDHAASARGAVAFRGRDFEFAFLAHAHVAQSFVPAFDDLTNSHCRRGQSANAGDTATQQDAQTKRVVSRCLRSAHGMGWYVQVNSNG